MNDHSPAPDVDVAPGPSEPSPPAASGPIRIATRSSPMAMAQARMVAGLLDVAGAPSEIVPLTTSGDRWQGDLAQLGGKGAFVKEIDRALLSGEADLAVHCLKDIPGDVPLPEGLVLAGFLPREDVADAVIARPGVRLEQGLDSLPEGAVVGTSAVRRQAQLRRHYPKLRTTPVRGNANSRLAKLDAGDFDVLILATAGLRRLDLAERITATLPADAMIPAIGAGQLVLAARADDERTTSLAGYLNERRSQRRASAERALLAELRGHCQSPIAGHAWTEAYGRMALRAAVFSLDGERMLEARGAGPEDAPEELGRAVAADLLAQGARDLIAASA